MSVWAAGDTVHGHRLVAPVGAGRDGEVWRAMHLGQEVALKILSGPRPVSALRRALEAQVRLGRLAGPDGRWFPRIEHADLDADPPWLRMSFIPGMTLEDLLRSAELTLEERLDLAEQALEALAVVHRHDLIHGDLSPQNVRVTPQREVRLIDVGFGAAAEEAPDIVTSSPGPGEAQGVAAPLYAAPERFDRVSGPGKAADIFSFGKLLYRLITGEQPFVVKPVTLKARALGAAWDAFLFKCLEERPENRHPDAPAALAELRRLRRPTAVVRFVEEPGRADAEAASEAEVSMLPAAFATLLGYLFFWVPGALLNAAYLVRAREIEASTGKIPFGTGALRVMQALLFWLPLGLLAAGILLAASLVTLVRLVR